MGLALTHLFVVADNDFISMLFIFLCFITLGPGISSNDRHHLDLLIPWQVHLREVIFSPDGNLLAKFNPYKCPFHEPLRSLVKPSRAFACVCSGCPSSDWIDLFYCAAQLGCVDQEQIEFYKPCVVQTGSHFFAKCIVDLFFCLRP